MRTLEEQVEEFDANPEMHYYVYFSTSRYQYCVDVIHFKSISDIKSKYYSALSYYDTYAEATAEADRMNKEDTDVRHLICRAIKVFDDSLFTIIDRHGTQLNSLGRYAVSVLRNMCQFVQNVMNVEKKKTSSSL